MCPLICFICNAADESFNKLCINYVLNDLSIILIKWHRKPVITSDQSCQKATHHTYTTNPTERSAAATERSTIEYHL